MSTALRPATARWADIWTTAFKAAAGNPAVPAEGCALLGTLGPLNIGAGVVTTKIHVPGVQARIRPVIGVPVLGEEEWDRIYAALSQDPVLAAALRGERLPDVLTDPARTAGVPLMPSAAELSLRCNCGAESGICPHTAALGHAFAQRLRTAPAVLLSLRGRAHKHLRAHLATGGVPAPSPAPDLQPDPDGIPAEEAYRRWRNRPTGAAPPDDRAAPPGEPEFCLLDGSLEEPPAPAPSLTVLSALADDAARRARALLRGEHRPPAGDSFTDAVRLLATSPGAPWAAEAAERLGLAPGQLRRLGTALEYGGLDGLQVTLHRLPADPDTLAQAEAAIQPLRPAPLSTLERDHNRVTDPGARVQLRLGPDGRWYPFTDWLGTWRPAPGPSPDPAMAYKAARQALSRQPGGG
ncbi:hypothetical protein [Streptomyces orinoci]|uniref:SWIM-type domain-containing protein n=1 Tax=Streptomyces orinoci TaxID=67339 RepID=A0ABV3K7Y5_STRON|nr:hypothetical protein [Streptomyces orinoci]